MAEQEQSASGAIVWRDLTIDDAQRVSDFYAHVVGWKSEAVSMGDYDDFNMLSVDGQVVAGICHRRGLNSKVPPQWLIYVQVPDVSAAAARCNQHGGQVIDGPREMSGQQFCVIRDPAGAVAALIGPK